MESKRIYAFGKPTDSNTSIITITRDSGFNGSACYYALYINDALALSIGASETAQLFVPAGEVTMRVSFDPNGSGLCTLNKDWTQREFILKQNMHKFFRISTDAGSKIDIQTTVGGN